MLQRLPFEKFHRDKRLGVVLADFVNRADVGMVQRRRSLGLTLKTLNRLWFLGKLAGKNFRATKRQFGVFGLVHHTHPAAAELVNNAVMRNRFADQLLADLYLVEACLVEACLADI